MMKIISSEETQRQSGTRRIDGLLYTNNALMATERALAQIYNPGSNSWSTQIARGNGNLQINGAVIAPDMAIMAPDGQFQVNYDGRIPGFTSVMPGVGANSNTPQTYDMVLKGMVKKNGALPSPDQLMANGNGNGNGGGSGNGSGNGSNGSGSNGSGSNGSGSNGSGNGNGNSNPISVPTLSLPFQ